MLKLMDKKIFTILPSKSVFIFTYDYLPMIITKKKLNNKTLMLLPIQKVHQGYHPELKIKATSRILI